MSKRRYVLAGSVALMALALVLWWSQARVQPEPGAPPPAPARPSPLPAAATAPQGPQGVPAARPPVRLTSSAVTKDDSAANGAFEGQVFSTEDNTGVPRAELTFSLSGAAFSTQADAQGRFAFLPPRPGAYRLAAVTAPGFLPFAPEWGYSPISLTAQPGARIRGIKLFLTPAIEYLGRVSSPAGLPVAGAEVQILDTPAGSLALSPATTRFTTDAKGEVRFRAPDGALLEARHPDFLPARVRLGAAEVAARAATFRLVEKKPGQAPPPPQRIAGRVLDPAGNPLEGALVDAQRLNHEVHNLNPALQTTSDEEGRFILQGLDPGTHVVTATAPGLVPAQRTDVAAGTTDLELRLSAGGKLTGTVRDEKTGAPIPSFTLQVFRREGLARHDLLTQAVMDPRGHYEVTVPPGDLAIMVAAYGYGFSEEKQVTVTGLSPAVADLDLARGGRIVGAVVEEETHVPLSRARLSIEGRMNPAASAVPILTTTTADERGQFSLEGLPAGPRSVVVAAEGHHSRIFSGVEVPPGGTVGPLTLELARMQPGESPQVELVGIGAVLQPRGEALMIVRTLPGGGAAEAGLTAGDQVLRIDGQEVTQVGFDKAIQLIRGPENSTVRLTLRRGPDTPAVEVAVIRRRIRG